MSAKILVVESESIIALDLKQRLKKSGYAVPSVAYSGEAAISRAAEILPDLVLIDLGLKGAISAIDTAEKIHARFKIPFIYTTTSKPNKTLEPAQATEPWGYIFKPFQEIELYATIETSLSKRIA